MSNIVLFIWFASWPSFVAKTLTLDIMHTLFDQIFFMPAMFIGNIDFYHFRPFSVSGGGGGGGEGGVPRSVQNKTQISADQDDA